MKADEHWQAELPDLGKVLVIMILMKNPIIASIFLIMNLMMIVVTGSKLSISGNHDRDEEEPDDCLEAG